MKTIILTLLAVAGLGFTAPSAEARDRRDHKRSYSDRHHHHHRHGYRPRVIYRSYPRYYYSGYGQRYYYTDPYYRPYRYYRPGGATFILRF